MRVSRVVFFILLVVGIIIFTVTSANSYDVIIQKEEDIRGIYAERIDNTINDLIKSTEVLDVLVTTGDKKIDVEQFHKVAAAFYNEDLNSVISYLPDGVAVLVYPATERSDFIGVDILEHPLTAVDAIKSKETKEIVISGPFDLVLGNTGIAVRNPVYIDNKFHGFFSISVEMPCFLNYVGISGLEDLGYQYELITEYEGENIVASQSNHFNRSKAVYKDIKVGENVWHLGLYVDGREYQILSNGLFWFFAILLINIILLRIFTNYEKSKMTMTTRLETDNLTGAYNRTKLQQYYDKKNKDDFALFYIDLNNFKPVNDNYGHEVGDKLLIAYVKRLKSNFKSDTIIARMGGDEFALITPNINNDNDALAIKNRVKKLSGRTFMIDDIGINISASVGYALSSEAPSLEKLMKIADQKMYVEKVIDRAKR